MQRTSKIISLIVVNNPGLRAEVLPPLRPCPPRADALMSDPLSFLTPSVDDAYECTTLCRGPALLEVDSALNAAAFCRCLPGRGGSKYDCAGCAANFYTAWLDPMHSECRPCPTHASTLGHENRTTVEDCACNAGRFLHLLEAANGTCRKCPAGKQKPSWDFGKCSPCSAGRFSREAGSSSCSLCKAGRYATESGSTTCKTCPAGRAASDNGMTECSKCHEGSAMPDSNATGCARCQLGFFANTAGMVNCIGCDPGLTTRGLGAIVKLTECICPQNKFLTEVLPQMICSRCTEGMTCDPGAIDWSLSEHEAFAGQQSHPHLLPAFMTLSDPRTDIYTQMIVCVFNVFVIDF